MYSIWSKRLGVVQVVQPCKIGIIVQQQQTSPGPSWRGTAYSAHGKFILPSTTLHKICLTHYLLLQFNQYKFRLETYALIICTISI